LLETKHLYISTTYNVVGENNMRNKTEFKRICVHKELYIEILKDRKHFQEVIGGGKWSISDTLKEWKKIINLSKEADKR